MKFFKKHQLAIVSIAYWFLLLYMIAALLWWFIELNNQNNAMAYYKLLELKKSRTKILFMGDNVQIPPINSRTDEEGNVITPEQHIITDYREDTFRFPIPRADKNEDALSLPARLRGKYMICDYELDSDIDHTFEIP